MCRFFLFAVLIAAANSERFKVIREWKYLNYTWPSAEDHDTAYNRGSYIPQNNIISGLDYHDNYYYLTVPRMKDGVPATIVRIPAGNTKDTSPDLEPYPSWEMNKEGDCNAFQNVQNIEIDPKGQMWIIDSGRTETLTKPSSRCAPKLVIYDLIKNSTTAAYTFPENIASSTNNFLYDIVIDDTDGGYAYITDNSARDPGIIVFSVKDHHSWKIRHSKSMRADPSATTFKVNGVIINSPLNIASIALGPKIHKTNDRIVVDEDREVYYSPISSLHLYSINTTVLRNERNGNNDGEYQGNVKDYGIKGSQSTGMIMNNEGILYYILLGTNSIARWDSHNPFVDKQKKQKIISRDEKYLEWPSSFAFDNDGYLTVLVNKLNKFIYERLNLNEPNFRLISSHTGEKSYLFNQGYDYNIDANITKPVTVQTKAPEPEILPGSDNDPYLIPHPIPERTESQTTTTTTPAPTNAPPQPEPSPSPEPEPTAEPEPKPEPEPEPEPTSEPEPKYEPDAVPAKPEPEPEPEPKIKAVEVPTQAEAKGNVTAEPSGASSVYSSLVMSMVVCILVLVFTAN